MKKYLLLTGILAIMIGCGKNKENENVTNEQPVKDEILIFIEENWQNPGYGYSSKPVKYIAISFDDAPCAPSAYGGTAAMLEKLDELKVKATFFVIGQNVRNNRSAASAIFNAGHEIASHSDNHAYLGEASGLSVDDIAKNLNAASQTIKDITGKLPVLFRAPYIDHGTNLSIVCTQMGMALIDGTGHNDWPGNSIDIKNSVLANSRDGGIILLHDNNTSQGNTLNVLPEIIMGLREKGFWIMTVGELAAVKGKTPKAGVRYGSF
jgi:peptidoglycan/xylan/chitin deacetylase (PgdA/CDA1 family)